MAITYDVCKERGSNRFYVYAISDPSAAVSEKFLDKKKAFRTAAKMNGIDTKTFMKERKETKVSA